MRTYLTKKLPAMVRMRKTGNSMCSTNWCWKSTARSHLLTWNRRIRSRFAHVFFSVQSFRGVFMIGLTTQMKFSRPKHALGWWCDDGWAQNLKKANWCQVQKYACVHRYWMSWDTWHPCSQRSPKNSKTHEPLSLIHIWRCRRRLRCRSRWSPYH